MHHFCSHLSDQLQLLRQIWPIPQKRSFQCPVCADSKAIKAESTGAVACPEALGVLGPGYVRPVLVGSACFWMQRTPISVPITARITQGGRR